MRLAHLNAHSKHLTTTTAAVAQVMTQPSYREAAARVSAAARMEAEYRPPLEMAAQEIELALTHMDYGRWRPYDASRKAAAGTTDSSQQEL